MTGMLVRQKRIHLFVKCLQTFTACTARSPRKGGHVEHDQLQHHADDRKKSFAGKTSSGISRCFKRSPDCCSGYFIGPLKLEHYQLSQ